MTHNALSLTRIGKSFINFKSTHWRHQSFIEIHNIFSKNPRVKYDCIVLIYPLPPTRFGSPILTIILDPRPSVDMVLPVFFHDKRKYAVFE